MKRSASACHPAANSGDSNPWNGFLIHIYPKKISATQRKLVSDSCRRQNLEVADNLRSDVTHVITNLERERVYKEVEASACSAADIMTLSWLTSSLAARRPLANDAFKEAASPNKRPAEAASSEPDSQEAEPKFEDTTYACLSATPLMAVHQDNQKFVDALLSLEKARELIDYNSEARGSRSLAFRRASCKLKIYPRPITSAKQVAGLDGIGRHSLQVIEEILKGGQSKEVNDYNQDSRLQTLKTFSAIYGCGPAGAAKWYSAGARSIEDLRSGKFVVTDRQQVGLQYHEYLQVLVSLEEGQAIRSAIEEEVQSLSPGMTATLAGGFRRGKKVGHDIDILLHHSSDDYETDFLQVLVAKLRQKGLLVHSELAIGKNNSTLLEKSVASHYHRDTTFYQRTQKMDHLDKAYCMFDIPSKLLRQHLENTTVTATRDSKPCPGSDVDTGADSQELVHEQASSDPSAPPKGTLQSTHPPRPADSPDGKWWTTQEHFVRRVDLIVCPHKQWAYALVGWTGSKQFNRSLRLYAARTKQILLNSQTMYSQTAKEFIPAETEEDIFNHLGVPTFPPHLRNC